MEYPPLSRRSHRGLRPPAQHRTGARPSLRNEAHTVLVDRAMRLRCVVRSERRMATQKPYALLAAHRCSVVVLHNRVLAYSGSSS